MKVEIYCSKCRRELTLQQGRFTAIKDCLVYIEPCEYCLDVAVEEANKKSFDDGYEAGVEEREEA